METSYKEKINQLTVRNFDNDTEKARLRELVLYIANQCSNDEKFGSIKLNKILFAADVNSYLRRGVTISSAQYMKEKKGPVPVQMKPVLDELVNNGDLVFQERLYWGRQQKRPINVREANLDLFSGNDIAILDETIKNCGHLNATEMSDLSHGVAWEIASKGAVIPMQAFLYKDRQTVNGRLTEKALRLIDEQNWNVKTSVEGN